MPFVQQALRYEETPHNLYFLHAWVILPNQMHVILEPRLALPEITRSWKGKTGRKANQILGRRGQPFWQDESYDHWVLTTKELNEPIRYVENNPVQAGLVAEEAQWPWSSARMRADDTPPEADEEPRSSAPRELMQMAKLQGQAEPPALLYFPLAVVADGGHADEAAHFE